MQLTETASERALADEVRAFLSARGISLRGTSARARRPDGRTPALAGRLLRRRLRRTGMAGRVRWRGPPARRADRRRPGTRRGRRARVREHRRARRSRALAAALRQRRAATALHPADPVGGGDLVSGLLRAGGRLGSRQPAHARGAGRRHVRDQRPEDVGVVGSVRELVRTPGADRRLRAPPPRDLDADRGHVLARRRGAADDPDHRPRRVQRAVPRRRRRPAREPARRARRRLEDRDAHARARAGDGGAAPAGQAADMA